MTFSTGNHHVSPVITCNQQVINGFSNFFTAGEEKTITFSTGNHHVSPVITCNQQVINGFSNFFYGWGGEDDYFFNR
jgi:hypothetical protein